MYVPPKSETNRNYEENITPRKTLKQYSSFIHTILYRR